MFCFASFLDFDLPSSQGSSSSSSLPPSHGGTSLWSASCAGGAAEKNIYSDFTKNCSGLTEQYTCKWVRSKINCKVTLAFFFIIYSAHLICGRHHNKFNTRRKWLSSHIFFCVGRWQSNRKLNIIIIIIDVEDLYYTATRDPPHLEGYSCITKEVQEVLGSAKHWTRLAARQTRGT